MGFIIFKDGVYKAKSKEESDAMKAWLEAGNLFYTEDVKETKEKFNKITIEKRKKLNGTNNN